MRLAAATTCLLAAAALSGCTHLQLTRNTAMTATTVTSIQYRMVLDNIATMACEPGALPAHVRLADGTVQISNQVGFGQSGGFTWFRGGDFGIERYGPFGSTRVSEQWGTDAVEDPIQLWELQSLYRRVLGLPTLCEPNFIADAIRLRAQKRAKDSTNSSSKSDSDDDSSLVAPQAESIASGVPAAESDDDAPPRPPELVAARSAMPGADDEPASESTDQSNGRAHIPSADEFEVPVGWFRMGRKCDVPKNACYVGHHRDRYAWVTAEGVEGLSQFTLAILTVTKLEKSAAGKSSLMFTP